MAVYPVVYRRCSFKGCFMYCILMSGLPASGKTTVAEYISKKMNLSVISKDDIKEILFDTIGFTSRENKLKLGIASSGIMNYIVEKMMQNNLPFIVDNNFENTGASEIKNLVKKYNYDAVTVLVDGDIDIIYGRFIERDKSPDRHRGHVVNTMYPEKETNQSEPILDKDTFESRYVGRDMRDFAVGKKFTVDSSYEGEDDLISLVNNIKYYVGMND